MKSNINDVSLEYLINPILNDKIKINLEKSDKEFENDKKFYRKRIVNLTKNLFNDDKNLENLNNIFNLYCKNIIEYLKQIDRKDIISNIYNNSDIEIINSNIDNDNIELNDKKLHIFNSIVYKESKKNLNLNKFINIKKNNNENNFPLQKDIDLKDPKLKKKGLKKKNI